MKRIRVGHVFVLVLAVLACCMVPMPWAHAAPDATVINPVTAPRLAGMPSGYGVAVAGLSNDKVAVLDPSNNHVKALNTNGSPYYDTDLTSALGSRAANHDIMYLYPIANGGVIVTVEGSTPGTCDSNTGNLFAFLRLDASGNVTTPLTNISAVTRSYNCFTRMVELSNGNLAFTYQITGSQYALRIFNPNGTAVTAETPVQGTGTGTACNGLPAASAFSSSIASNHNGRFLITHHCNTSNTLWGVLYNDDGSQVTVGGAQHFAVGTFIDCPLQSTMGLTDHNFMVAYSADCGITTFQFRQVQPDGTLSSVGPTYASPLYAVMFQSLQDGGFVALDSRAQTCGSENCYYDTGTIYSNSGALVQATTDLDTTYSQSDSTYIFFNPVAVTGYNRGILGFNVMNTQQIVMHGFVPTASTLASFRARYAAQKPRVTLHWQTANEMNVVGFNVWRQAGKGDWKMLNKAQIAAKQTGKLSGDKYSQADKTAKSDPDKNHPQTYRYKIEIVFADGHSAWSEVERVVVK